jgi:hypothetical protein
VTPESYREWSAHLHAAGPRMSDAELEACARLSTVLLCGEQSAIRIFAAEVRRGRAPAHALQALRSIEYDEHLHEQALREFREYLPRPNDAHALKRRAQRFFAGLGRVQDMARHFGQISLLDSAVCKIMWHIEHSGVDLVSPLQRLATQIKHDEARHVSVSRQYAAALGLPQRARHADTEELNAGLIDMLYPLGESFEVVDVDPDKLFAHIGRARSL